MYTPYFQTYLPLPCLFVPSGRQAQAHAFGLI
jgi:hypothetical protein